MKKMINNLKQLPKHGAILPGSAPGNELTPNRNVQTNISVADAVAASNASLNPTVTTAPVDTTQAQIDALAQQKANEMIAQMQQAQILSNSGQTYSRFNPVEDIVDNQTQVVTAGLWSDNQGTLSTFFTASTQTISQIRHYVDVYQKDTSESGSAVQFAAAYGNLNGLGSSNLGTNENPASKAIYGQYARLLLDPKSDQFVTAGSGSTDHIYIINVQRNRMKEALDIGNWELPLTSINSKSTNASGSGVASLGSSTFTLIDDSSISQGSSGASGKIFNIVSGSIDNGVHLEGGNVSGIKYYGLFYPQHGILILDGKMLDQKLAFQSNTGSNSEGNNHFLLYHSISGSKGANNKAFEARNEETITSTHYFVRIKNGMYNFSNNPSYVTGSVGQIAQNTFIGDPVSYITTVGMYNDSNELLAVAKLSKPLLKSFSREALIRVKLDF
tara:strand:+ start:6672 stop:8003 length:1332 start_codon:yes stop_codon:yes gene_type:complete